MAGIPSGMARSVGATSMRRAARWPRRASRDRKTHGRIWPRIDDRLVLRGLLSPRRSRKSNRGVAHASPLGRQPERTDHVSKPSGQITWQQHTEKVREVLTTKPASPFDRPPDPWRNV